MIGGAAHAAPASRPRLAVVRADPVTVHGTAFRPHERVRVVLRRPDRAAATRRVRASDRGAFSASFAGVAVSRCGNFSVTATGSSGSRAAVPRRPLPACPPP
jgi:hypothetical protein